MTGPKRKRATSYLDLDEVPFGDEITGTIKDFANGEGLIAISYYHDLPVWIVKERAVAQGLVRRLQITAYREKRRFWLSVVPTVSLLDFKKGKKEIPAQSPVTRLRFADFSTQKELIPAKLLEFLQSNWEKTQELKRDGNYTSHFVEVTLSKHIPLPSSND